jgi:hypothetical protein
VELAQIRRVLVGARGIDRFVFVRAGFVPPGPPHFKSLKKDRFQKGLD